MHYGEVEYLSQHDIDIKLRSIQSDLEGQFSVARAANALLLKREAFDHESEYRAVLHIPNLDAREAVKGVKLKVDPHKLIDSVLLDPRAPNELASAFAFYFKEKLGFMKRVARSVLYKTQSPIVVGTE